MGVHTRLKTIAQRMEHGRADHRKREIDAFQAADVFGLRDDANASNQHSVLDFFDKAYPFRVYKEQIAKLLNAAASDIVARDYFCASHRFLSMVSGAMMAEPRDTILRQNLLGVLEKLSVR